MTSLAIAHLLEQVHLRPLSPVRPPPAIVGPAWRPLPRDLMARLAGRRAAERAGDGEAWFRRHRSRSAHRTASSTRQSIQAAPPRTTRKPMTANTYIAVRYHSRSSHIALAPVVVTLASLFFPVRQEPWHQPPPTCAPPAPTVPAGATRRRH